MRPSLLHFVVIAALASASPASAEHRAILDGTTKTLPVATSTAAPQRHALILGAAALDGREPARVAVAKADAARYRELLRLLGFEVTTVFAATRPELGFGINGFAEKLGPNTEVAVFVLGAVLPRGEDLYLVASDTRPAPDQYPIAGLRIGDVMRTISNTGAKETVLLVDECHAASGETCRIGAGTVPDNVSAIVGTRVAPDGSGTPLAGLASLDGEMEPLMQRQGLTYLDLFTALKERLAGSNMTVAASPSLTRSFAFLPADFFPGLAVPCNKLDPEATAESLRDGAPLAPLVAACVKAADTWSFADYFKDRLAIAREQEAFQAAASGCDASKIAAYRGAYPGGRYLGALSAIETNCDAARRPPPPPELQPPAAPEEMTCTVGGLDPAGNNWLALRQEPNFQARWSPTRMGPGTVLAAFARSGAWVHVRLASGETGWANGKFLSCGDAAPLPRRSARPDDGLCEVYGLDPNGDNWLALRDRPSLQSSWSSTRMGPGTPLAVLGSSGTWLRVRLRSGETGWASGKYIRCNGGGD